MIQELKEKAREHWMNFLPSKWAELVDEDRVDQALTEAATAAEKAIRQWMAKGARLDEAEEMVLPSLIYLPPEKGATGLDKESQAESDQMEAQYQEMKAKEAKIDKDLAEEFALGRER